MQKLRVLTISHMFPSACSGRHGIFICREASFLRRHDVECSFLVGRPWAPWPLYHLRRWRPHGRGNPLTPPDGLEARRVEYLRPPGFGFRRFEGMSMARRLLPVARKWHDADPFDLVLGVSMLPDAEAAVLVGKQLDLPVASLAVGSDVMVYPERMPALQRRLAETLARSDLIVGVSESVCRRLAEMGRCRTEPVCVYLSRDTERSALAGDKARIREQLGWPMAGIVAVYVGGLVASKGVNELAKAAEPLLREHEDFRLVCVGDGPMRDVLRQLGDRIGRAAAVILPGRVPPQEVPRFLHASDFFVLPSHSEGMPQAVLEAMDCALPVVATRVGGVPEAVLDGRTGLLVEARCVEPLREAMSHMIRDEAFRQAAGRNGSIRAAEVFDPDRHARRLADALRSAARRGGPR